MTSALLGAAERQRCQDDYARNAGSGPAFGLDPKTTALSDANAARAPIISQPFLSEKPKNGCRPVVTHKDDINRTPEEMRLGLAWGKSF